MNRTTNRGFSLVEALIVIAIIGILLAIVLQPREAHAFWGEPSSDRQAAAQQEAMLKEAQRSLGMPAIRNFREKRLLKSIYELRDQDGLRTYTHIVAQQTAKPVLLCASIGYPISEATGYTSPDKVVRDNGTTFGTVIQAEPNGLFTPDSSDGYWVMCLDPKAGKATPTFVSGQIVVTTFPLQ